MSKINVRNLSNENEDGAPDIVGVTTFSATSYFVPTKGNTAQRPPNHLEEGSIRYNTDTKNLEYYRGHTLGWSQFELIDPDLGGGTGSNTGLGTRALFAGGDTPSLLNFINFATLSTMGDAQDFGDLSTARAGGAAVSNRKIFVFGGGYAPSRTNSIDTTIFASLGNAVDTADLVNSVNGMSGGAGNNIRGLIACGNTPTRVNTIQYYTFESAGDAVDFGDYSFDSGLTGSGCSSSTRSVISLGVSNASGLRVNNIEFVTTSTTGNSQDFGDLTTNRNGTGAFSNSTRGVWGGGETPSKANVIDYVTIATIGNAIDFGDMSYIRANANNDGASSATRGVFSGGGSPASGNDNSRMNVIEKVEILTTGNAVDFGDLQDHTSTHGVMSNNHGGL